MVGHQGRCVGSLAELGQDRPDAEQHVERAQEDQHRRVDGVVQGLGQVLGAVEVEHDQAGEQQDADRGEGDEEAVAADLELERDERHDDEDPEQDVDDLGEAGLGQVGLDPQADGAEDDGHGGDDADGRVQVLGADLVDEHAHQDTERRGDEAQVGEDRRQPAGVEDDRRSDDHADEDTDERHDDAEGGLRDPSVEREGRQRHDAVRDEDAEDHHRVVPDGRQHDVGGGGLLTATLVERLVGEAGTEVAHGELRFSQVCPGVGQQAEQSNLGLCYLLSNVCKRTERTKLYNIILFYSIS